MMLQGRIIKKAFGKLRLEHVVIGKGQFEQDRAKPNALDVMFICLDYFCTLKECRHHENPL
jgi:hypothetical protein